MSLENLVWVERYRPKKVSDCILPSNTAKEAASFVERGELPHLLLTGPAGTGKTTLAKALCNELDMEWMIINGSNEGRLLDTLRTKIMQFASTVSFEGKKKCIILDEADYIPQDTVQPALRNFIEEFSSNCVFILTCNFPNRLMDAIHSRCSTIDFTIPMEEREALEGKMFKRVFSILKENGIEFEKAAVAELVLKHFPDFRRTLNELQRYAATGKIDSGIFANSADGTYNRLIEILKDKNFKEMREWVASAPNLDIAALNRYIYDNLYEVCKKDSMPQVVLTLADYAYKDAFVADKEINIAAMCTQLMLECEFV